MTKHQLATLYRGYIDCLNRQGRRRLGEFVHDDVQRNGRALGLWGYQAMLEENYADIPDLQFHVELLTVDPPRLAARLLFDCRPQGVSRLVDSRQTSLVRRERFLRVPGRQDQNGLVDRR